MTVHVFHGPTITRDEVAAILPAARTHAPIRHGDLLALADRGPGDTVVIIDGVFHATPPVRHKEILLLLAEGIAVVGASSMGALRAAELHRYGMTGIGRVFEMYRDGTIEADDEVAVAHTPDDHRPLSVALVSIRVELSEAGSTGVLKESEAGRLLAMARELPYQRRTWAALRRAGTQAGDPELADAVARLTDWQLTRPATDAKHADALQALTAVARGDVTPPDPSPWARTSWHTVHARQWTTRFHRRDQAARVPLAAELQHQQLYDPGYPARWRRAVLAWIADGTPEPTSDPASTQECALATAARALGLDDLSVFPPERLADWLTPQELADHGLDAAERLTRLLVRSAHLGTGGSATLTLPGNAERLLNPRLDSASVVQAAWRVNEMVAASAPHRAVHRLRPDLLRAHLAGHWNVRVTDEPALTAAARDRGFTEFDGAITAARAFYLHTSGAVAEPSPR